MEGVGVRRVPTIAPVTSKSRRRITRTVARETVAHAHSLVANSLPRALNVLLGSFLILDEGDIAIQGRAVIQIFCDGSEHRYVAEFCLELDEN